MFFSLLKCTYSNNCLSLKQPRVWVLHVQCGNVPTLMKCAVTIIPSLEVTLWPWDLICFYQSVSVGQWTRRPPALACASARFLFNPESDKTLTLNLSTVWNYKNFLGGKGYNKLPINWYRFSSINNISLILPKSLKHASSKWSRSLFCISSIHTWKGL